MLVWWNPEYLMVMMILRILGGAEGATVLKTGVRPVCTGGPAFKNLTQSHCCLLVWWNPRFIRILRTIGGVRGCSVC